jgi:hypothetical protein
VAGPATGVEDGEDILVLVVSDCPFDPGKESEGGEGEKESQKEVSRVAEVFRQNS